VVAILVILLVLGLTGNSSNDPGGSTTPKRAAKAKKTKTSPTKVAERTQTQATRRPHAVRLRIVPAGATYVCLDKGTGTPVVYEGTLDGPKSWRARHLRINLGRRAVRITVNGKRVQVPAGSDPVGFDFRPTHTRELPIGQRPCA
jgi:hypothetical protein